MRRGAELIVRAALAVGAPACMRIYPDPDLPDLRVAWSSTSCPVGGAVRFAVVDADVADGTPVEAAAPCDDDPGRDPEVRIPDVARARLEVEASIATADGEVITRAREPVDTRDGNNKRVVVSFPDPTQGFLRFAWTFAPGASCASVGATAVDVSLTSADGSSFAFGGLPCEQGALRQPIPVTGGTYALQVLASRQFRVYVARSIRRDGVVIRGHGEVTDVGALELTPCGGACPPP